MNLRIVGMPWREGLASPSLGPWCLECEVNPSGICQLGTYASWWSAQCRTIKVESSILRGFAADGFFFSFFPMGKPTTWGESVGNMFLFFGSLNKSTIGWCPMYCFEQRGAIWLLRGSRYSDAAVHKNGAYPRRPEMAFCVGTWWFTVNLEVTYFQTTHTLGIPCKLWSAFFS